MDASRFIKIRKTLNKSQSRMAQLLGVSLKAVQSYEQAWRNIPLHVQRQMLLLLHLKDKKTSDFDPCWDTVSCPENRRNSCPAYEFKVGHLCWLINGTNCQALKKEQMEEERDNCSQCKVIRQILDKIES